MLQLGPGSAVNNVNNYIMCYY